MGRGMIIAVEGCDRTGKSSLCKKLKHHIDEEMSVIHFMPIVIDSPNRDTKIGQLLRKYLEGKIELTDVVAHHLFSANRWELSQEIENLISYSTIILDRYVASGSAYTAAKGHLTLEWCEKFNTGLPKPDLVIYLECDPKELKNRKGFGAERFETKRFQKSVRKNFDIIREREENWLSVDVTSLTPTEVCKKVTPKVFEVLSKLRYDDHPVSHYT
jgi:dTMP kinase